ncbi:Mitogen-activated protein kinase kinase kinase NPK1 [Rhynchospora pubera]|uniref:mitogen-activated protein kinase kinase kinase n=1 Tax=Rhynchospora pubera TaxID=906938 RepID=A0AAV8BSC2_9POAL|nr:Mitogen-activated protein kinase kinase kinase NPK1 [Rhynchospora pubera]
MKGEESLFGSVQDLFGSVRRSLVFRPNPSSDEPPNTSIVDRIGSCIRKSRVGLGLGFVPKSPLRRLTMGASVSAAPVEEEPPPRIRWRKGEMIGCGAFGQVFMGMNLDSGELLAVKQVLIGTSNASKEKAQAHIRELEEEVKLLKNLSHPNIVRYLGTVREENTLNILLEFVPGGSISSLLSKFGSFPEPVIRMYTKQLLQGLEYLHQYKIIHRDIKGANILVDNKGCIKLADFGASKQVAKLATMTAAKSMKGTPYWMAPEVIVQSGHSFSADIWSVGCTVIEMATGKPPWSGQYQEVAALFHVGTTKSHPPIPEHLSLEAKDFLLKCLQEEPSLRPTASDLLQHPFVTGELEDAHQLNHAGSKESYNHVLGTNKTQTCNFSGKIMESDKVSPARPVWESSNDDDDMCRLDDGDDFPVIGSSFNPMSEPLEEWPCKFDISPEQRTLSSQHLVDITADHDDITRSTLKVDCSGTNEFSFPSDAACEDDDEVTEFKIRAFLDEKALDLKKLQTPLYEEFYNSLNASNAQVISSVCKENMSNNCNNNTTNASKLPPMTPIKNSSAALPTLLRSGSSRNASPGGSFIRRMSRCSVEGTRILQEITSPQRNEWVPPEHHSDNQEPLSPSASVSERRRKWTEELVQELERQREMRQATLGRMSSPKSTPLNRKRDRDRPNK